MLPEIIKVNIGYDYLEMLLCYTLTKIEQSDKIELEKLLTSKLTQETGVKIMGSLAHHWEQIGEARGIQLGKAEGKAEFVKLLLKNGNSVESIAKMTGMSINKINELLKMQ
ncbi:RpnC/YadD family protein [Rickettsia endosymbiont of Oedothorax gibbosus]|uniref:hypothetical protein n=1 Tax=Rickettsia endosymbiont of Oedothorax gibbosus TaxID=931099 RepID=UPI002024A460|nr:hypothetical protein [Rickettsia endosymbiont of Oedothorax gibbosus]